MPIRIRPQLTEPPAFDQMMPGEIYAEGGAPGTDPRTGAPRYTGPEYIVPDYDPKSPRDLIARETGYEDYQTMQDQMAPTSQRQQHVERLENMAGRAIPELQERYTYFDPERAQRFERMSDADKMAIAFVDAGLMKPKEWYAEAKKDARMRDDATLKALEKLPFDRATMSQGDEMVPTSGAAIADFMSQHGKTSAEFADPVTRQIITSTSQQSRTGGGGGGGGSGRMGAGTDAKEIEAQRDNLVSALTAATNTLSTLRSDSKNVGEAAIADQEKRVNHAQLTHQLFAMANGTISATEATRVATRAITGGRMVSADANAGPLIYTDQGAPMLNLNGVFGVTRAPVIEGLLHVNDKTGQLYTVDELIQYIRTMSTGAGGAQAANAGVR